MCATPVLRHPFAHSGKERAPSEPHKQGLCGAAALVCTHHVAADRLVASATCHEAPAHLSYLERSHQNLIITGTITFTHHAPPPQRTAEIWAPGPD